MVTKIHVISGSVMLSEVKHLYFSVVLRQRNNLRFFAPLRMTFRGELGFLFGLYHGHEAFLDCVGGLRRMQA